MEFFSCFALPRKIPTLFVSSLIRVPNYPKSRFSRANEFRFGTPKHFQWNFRSPKDLSSDLQHRTRVANVSNDLENETELSAGIDEVRILEELQKEAEETLEWSSVCSQVSSFASTSMGRAVCERGDLPIGRDRAESQKLLDQTAAANLLPQPLNLSGVEDVLGIISSAVSGELLTVRELCAVERSLQAAKGVFEQLVGFSSTKESSKRYAPLLEILRDCNFLSELVLKIESCVDCNLSIILDQANKKLESIRAERKRNSEILESLLKGTSTRIFQAGGIDSPLITKRRSRMCVGIRASHKSLLPDGIILGVSGSGATYFMEPRDAVELNNMEVRLSNSEKAEELAILHLLSSEIASLEIEIRNLMEKVLELDLASARGAYSLWMKCACPVFSEFHEEFEPNKSEIFSVDIEGICHPLLLEPSLRRASSAPASSGSSIFLNKHDVGIDSRELAEFETVVPVDIKIQHATKVVVISGPNTGGKTASMKTLGLASLMSKAGLFLPAKNHPRLPWFNRVLADIGDHQSLEHNLSTFSGHISRICKILNIASEHSLVLIDEIGNGTDPAEGVALSTSILQYLADRVGLAVVTTHFADLSRLKAEDSRFENAAMEFCIKTLQPTYRILWGSSGDSNALNIAKSIGFDQKVLDRAQEWVEKLVPDKQKERLGFLYQSLLEERNVLEAQASKAAMLLSDVKQLYHEIYSEAKELDNREASLKAKESAHIRRELQAAKSQMDAVVKDFENKLQNANPDQYNSIIRQSDAAIASIVEAHCSTSEESLGESEDQSSYIPQIGDQVRVKGLGDRLATIIEAPGDDGNALVKYGKIGVRVKKDDMKLIQSSAKDTPSSSNPRLTEQSYIKRASTEPKNTEEIAYGPVVQTSKNTVDLRGMRAEEASNYLNMAIASSRSYGVLFVVHGMGTGVVKECALGILRKHPRVVKFEEESPMNYGCTIAYIK